MLTGPIQFSARHQAGRLYGLSPIVQFQFFGGGPGLYAEPWLRAQAKPCISSGGVASIKRNLLFFGFTAAETCVSRDIPAPGNPVSTGSIATQLSRIGRHRK
jgi:hypothetical protein